MKRIVTFYFIFISITNYTTAQDIYGFVGRHFVSLNILKNSTDTLISFSGGPWNNIEYRSCIDRYNGYYYFGGQIPGRNGDFHRFDLLNRTVESFPFSPMNMEYNSLRNSILYEWHGDLYSLDLNTMSLQFIAKIDNGNANLKGQFRTFNPNDETFLYLDFTHSDIPYYTLVDALTGSLVCEAEIDTANGFFRTPRGMETNDLTSEIFGNYIGAIGIIDPCDSQFDVWVTVPNWRHHLNNQIDVLSPVYNKYFAAFLDSNSHDKYAIVNLSNKSIDSIIDQPFRGEMNWQELYDQPQTIITEIRDTLFVPYGNNYNWYLNGKLVSKTTSNYYIPKESGMYSADVQFRGYVSQSKELSVIISSTVESFKDQIEISPNPVIDQLNIQIPENLKIIELEICNLNGMKILSEHSGFQKQLNIDLNYLQNGLYFLLAKTTSGTFTKKFSKE